MQHVYTVVPNREIRRYMKRHNCSREEAEKAFLKKQDQFFRKKETQYKKRTITLGGKE